MTNKSLKKTLHDRWKRFWNEYQTKNKRKDCVALTSQIFEKRLKLHDNLFKIENNLITQMRTNRIELTKYLFHRWIFIIVISACFCDWLRQTLKHVMFFCFNHNRTRENMLLVAKTQNLRRLLNINKKVRMMTRWLMKTNILAQFSLTIKCLEWFRSAMWAKRMHTKLIKRSQYFAFKTITRRLDDEKAKRDFYFSEDFSFIHIVYSNFRMSRLKSITQRVSNIIIIIIIIKSCNIFFIKVDIILKKIYDFAKTRIVLFILSILWKIQTINFFFVCIFSHLFYNFFINMKLIHEIIEQNMNMKLQQKSLNLLSNHLLLIVN
jgi:hypothetical protein